MKDYKLSEIRDICRKQNPEKEDNSCITCPISDICSDCFYDTITLPCEWDIDVETKIAKCESETTTSASTSDDPMIIEATTPNEWNIN